MERWSHWFWIPPIFFITLMFVTYTSQVQRTYHNWQSVCYFISPMISLHFLCFISYISPHFFVSLFFGHVHFLFHITCFWQKIIYWELTGQNFVIFWSGPLLFLNSSGFRSFAYGPRREPFDPLSFLGVGHCYTSLVFFFGRLVWFKWVSEVDQKEKMSIRRSWIQRLCWS